MLRYQWRVDGVAIGGATAASYAVPAAYVGKKITVTVTASRTGYTTLVKTSAPTVAVVAGTLGPAPVPTISGTVKVGYVLTAHPGTWGPSPVVLRYQWRVDGVAIGGATAATYTVPAAYVGKKITVTVTASKAGYTTLAKTSAPTVAVAAPQRPCNPVSPSGKCYEAGQFCPAAWHGRTGVDGEGYSISCLPSGNRWRWFR